jgi:hypothetical protein
VLPWQLLGTTKFVLYLLLLAAIGFFSWRGPSRSTLAGAVRKAIFVLAVAFCFLFISAQFF